MATRTATHAARAALLMVSAATAGILWMCCASSSSHEHYARTHSLPTLDGQPLQPAVYANSAR